MLLARALLLLALLLPASALAQRETTREALVRLEETLAMRVDDGRLATRDLVPAIVVSAAPAYDESRAWYPAAALSTLTRVLGAASLRSCEACMAPRVHVGEGRLEQSTAPLSIAEIVRLDEASRGTSAPARTAIWLDENGEGVSLRVIDLSNGRVVIAENFDPQLVESARTKANFRMAQELERRARGDSITHTFVDLVLYPGQHVSLDWVEQWGETNQNLSGLTLSLWDPLLGVGGVYYRVVPSAWNLTVGAQVVLSVPTALAQSITDEQVDLVDRIVTGVFFVRLPITTSNWALTLSASTNGRVGLGVSLLNVSLLPFLP